MHAPRMHRDDDARFEAFQDAHHRLYRDGLPRHRPPPSPHLAARSGHNALRSVRDADGRDDRCRALCIQRQRSNCRVLPIPLPSHGYRWECCEPAFRQAQPSDLRERLLRSSSRAVRAQHLCGETPSNAFHARGSSSPHPARPPGHARRSSR